MYELKQRVRKAPNYILESMEYSPCKLGKKIDLTLFFFWRRVCFLRRHPRIKIRRPSCKTCIDESGTLCCLAGGWKLGEFSPQRATCFRRFFSPEGHQAHAQTTHRRVHAIFGAESCAVGGNARHGTRAVGICPEIVVASGGHGEQ